MAWALLADAVVVLHLAVVAYIVLGGLLAWRWPRAALAHLPFAAWGVAIELARWTCPLTPLENHLRRLAGEASYEGGFVEHYLVPILYPAGLDAGAGAALAALLLAANLAIYLPLAVRWRRSGRPPTAPRPASGARPGSSRLPVPR